jgi:SAM-dependent methyltransferase
MGIQKKIKLFISNRFSSILYPFIAKKTKTAVIVHILSSEFLNHKEQLPYSFVNTVILNHFNKNYNPNNPTEYYREIIKNYVWGGTTGMKWHVEEAEYDQNLDKYKKWRKIQIDQIKDFLKYNNHYQYIVEIGCGNGKYIDFLSRNLGAQYKYIGIDLSEEQIEWNKTFYQKNKNLTFYSEHVGNKESIHKESNTLYLTFGTLSCFTQKELDEWLHRIKPMSGKNAVSIAEWIIDYNYLDKVHSEPMSQTLYNHHYAFRVQNAQMVMYKLEYVLADDEYDKHTRTILIAENK